MSGRFRLVIIHSVPDYERWKAVLEDPPNVSVDGVLSSSVYRATDDPNEVMVQVECESAEAARQLLASVDLRELLDRAGIEIYPPVFIGERIDELSSDD